MSWACQESGWFEDEALAYFLPAWILRFLENSRAGQIYGRGYFTTWIARLSPLSDYGYTKEQIQLLKEVMQLVIDSSGRFPEECKSEIHAIKLLKKQL